MKKRSSDILSLIALLVTAAMAPWWAVIATTVVIACFDSMSLRRWAIMIFCVWGIVLAVRDFQNANGPTRVLAKLFSLEKLNLEPGSIVSRITVVAVVSLIFVVMSCLAAVATKSIKTFVREIAKKPDGQTLYSETRNQNRTT